jgi:hypothetical protein
MRRQEGTEAAGIPDGLIREVCARLVEGKRVRRALPGHGRLHIDRPLPFLCVYRHPPGRRDEGTDRLVLGQASYLVAVGEEALQESLDALVTGIVKTLSAQFGEPIPTPNTSHPPPTTHHPPPDARWSHVPDHHPPGRGAAHDGAGAG